MGYGKNTIGGIGGQTIAVTNGNDSGAGSLRHAIEGYTGAREIVITTNENIVLTSRINCTSGNITIQNDGSGYVTGRGITFNNCEEIILYNLRIRPGIQIGMSQDDIDNNDCVTFVDCNNVIVDHCVLGWSTDECLDISGSTNVTISNNIIHEALENVGHTSGNHAYATLITSGADNITFYNNLIAHCADRLPAITTINASELRLNVEMINNVIYNSKSPTSIQPNQGAITFSIRGNTRIAGIDTPINPTDFDVFAHLLDSGAGIPDTQYIIECVWYNADNLAPDTPLFLEYPEDIGHADYPIPEITPLVMSGLVVSPRLNAYNNIISNSGTINRDSHELRIVNDVINNTGNIIDNQSEVGG